MAPVLLIHGLFGCLSEPRMVYAFEGRAVFAPDLLGYGEWRDADMQDMTLERQADHVATWLRDRFDAPVHVVGHSIGGAVAQLFAARHPALAESLTSVEGNFTLKDAFWSSKIAAMPLAQVDDILAGYRADPQGWLQGAGVAPSDWTIEVAARWLQRQPASTLQAQARAVVQATDNPAYLDIVRDVLGTALPMHLIAGADTRGGWDVPQWVLDAAVSVTSIPDTGHMMMLQAPERFGQAVLNNFKW